MITQFKKGVLELCVLSLISRKDCYGYEIVEVISQVIQVSEGTIYPLLRRLTTEKYCGTYLKESTEGPPRKYYTISNTGLQRYEALRSEWESFSHQVACILQPEAEEGRENE